MGIFSSIGKFFSGDKNKKVETSSSQPWGPQASGLERGFGHANDFLNSRLNNQGFYLPQFGGNSRAALDQTAATARQPNPMLGQGVSTLNDVAGGGKGMWGQVARGEMVNSNPHREQALKYSLDDTEARIKASMGAGGRLGSRFYGEGMATGLGRVGAEARMAGYDTDMDRMLQTANQDTNNRLTATGMMPAMNEMRYADSDRLAAVGGAEDEMADRRKNWGWEQLGKYQGMFDGNYGQTNMSPEASPFMKTLGVVKGATSMFNPMSWGSQ